MNHRALFLVALGVLSAAALGKPVADIELTQQLSVESAYRFSGGFDTNRTGFQISGRRSWQTVPVEVSASVWAWKNFSATQYRVAESDVSLRQLRVSARPGNFDLSAGLQEVRWGETFGFQPIDLVSARNYRDYPLLDHGRNRIPVWLVKGSWQSGAVTLTALGNPKGEVPILPETLNGIAIVQPAQNRDWGVNPEFGAKVSVLLADANVDFFVYRHLSRMPAFLASPSGLVAAYRPVASLGTAFSKGFAEWVLRADAVYTLAHPTSDATLTRLTSQDTFNGTVGADWSPVAGLTFGAQLHADRYPTPSGRVSTGLSALIRKALLEERLDLEAQAFQSLTFRDRWLQFAARFRFLDGFEARFAVESLTADSASPLAFFAQAKGRVSTQVTYSF